MKEVLVDIFDPEKVYVCISTHGTIFLQVLTLTENGLYMWRPLVLDCSSDAWAEHHTTLLGAMGDKLASDYNHIY